MAKDNSFDIVSEVDLQEVDFFACSLEGQNCLFDTQNNAQFAIDDIQVTGAVPEPTTTALMALGLLGLALRSRRANR